ncbi:MAG: hypothetical protein PVH77_02935 [Phycisphaerales bacterium]
MKEKLLVAMLLFVTLWVSGCASIVTGKFQNIPVTSEPPGAKVRSDTGVSITTPGSFDMVRNQNHTLVAEYPGCEPQQRELKHGVQGWFWGNIILGGIIGGVIDMASGACDELQPKKVHFNFTPEGQAAANRQEEYLDSHPETSEEVRFAILNGLARKNMTKDEVLASLGKPDMIEEEKKFEVFIYNERTPSRYYLKNGVLKDAK